MKLIKVTELADILDVSKARAYELIRTGLIPSVRLGRQVRVDAQQLGEWIDRGGSGGAGGGSPQPGK